MSRSNTMAFQIGDTVRLKSGGPLMTVDNIDAGEGPEVVITCIWFEAAENKERKFKTSTLVAGTKSIGGDLYKNPRARR
jgi:uncharacterized protein YodC (DUF2158 family)